MDKKYWEKYYSEHGKDVQINQQSSFADFCNENYFHEKRLKIIDLGAGNGRDAIFFAQNNHEVIAIDQSINAINIEKEKMQYDVSKKLIPIADDFINYDYCSVNPIDVFYSRFTLHAINKNEEDILLNKIHHHLNINGLFCAEVRTINDPIFGIGEDCGDNAFRTDHYRRFIDSQEFLNKMLQLDFELLFFTEQNNLSAYKDDNPVLMRSIFRKK